MKKDKTYDKNIFDRLKSFVLTVVAVVAPFMFIYSQFQSLKTMQNSLTLQQNLVKQEEIVKKSKIDCHKASLEILQTNTKKDYIEEYTKCLNSLGL